MTRYKPVSGTLFAEDLETFANGNKWIHVFVLDFSGKKPCRVRRTILYPYCFNIAYYIDHPDFVIWMDYFILFPTHATCVRNCYISFLLLSEWLEMIYSNQLKQISSLLLKDKSWDNIAEMDKSQTYVDSWQVGSYGLTYNKSFSSLFNLIVLIGLSYLHFHIVMVSYMYKWISAYV